MLAVETEARCIDNGGFQAGKQRGEGKWVRLPGLLCRVLARGQKTVMPAADSPCVAPAQPF